MEVTVLRATPEPISHAGLCAGTSTGRDSDCERRALRCIDDGHLSILEHCTATVRIEGISRACANQLVRHRVGMSYTQESQRYVTADVSGDGWYVVPPSVSRAGVEEVYRAYMAKAGEAYSKLIESGVDREDARYALPNAAKTGIAVTLNARSLKNLVDLRVERHAQWEIRELAVAVVEALGKRDAQWGVLCRHLVKGNPFFCDEGVTACTE